MRHHIALVNDVPDLLADADCQKIAIALAMHLEGFCENRGLVTPSVASYNREATIPDGAYVLHFIDEPPADASGLEAYHTEENGRPDGLCFAGFLLKQGGHPLQEVSEAMGHEALEILADPHCDRVVACNVIVGGKVRAGVDLEVCDPMQGFPVVYDVNGDKVQMPGYTLESWEDAQGSAPFSYPPYLPAPFTVGVGGYANWHDGAGNTESVFGAAFPERLKELKTKHSRRRRHAAR